MSLKETWNRIAFGSNIAGQKPNLLREFKDTSDPDQFQELTQAAEEDSSGTPGELVATVYTLEGLEGNVDGELAYDDVLALSNSPSLVVSSEGSSEDGEQIREFREILGTNAYSLLVESGVLLAEAPVIPQGTNQEMGGQRGVLYVLDALTGNFGSWTINQLVNSQSQMSAWHSGAGSYSPSQVQANGSNNIFTSAMDTEYGAFTWGTPGGPGDVIVKGEYYELKAGKTFKTLTKTGADKRKNKKFGKELTRGGMPRIGSAAHVELMENNNYAGAISSLTNVLTKYVIENVWGANSVETKVFLNPTNIGNNNGWGDMSKVGGKSGAKAFCTAMTNKIASQLKSNPSLMSGLFNAWATAQGLQGLNPENLLIPGWDVGMISAVSIPELKTTPAAGMWDVSEYNSAGSSSQQYFKCRPMCEFTFAAWNLGSCSDKTIGGRNNII